MLIHFNIPVLFSSILLFTVISIIDFNSKIIYLFERDVLKEQQQKERQIWYLDQVGHKKCCKTFALNLACDTTGK